MQNLAVQIDPIEIPELKVVEAPLYMVGTQARGLGRNGSWEAFREDFSKHYTNDSRWCGGRFVLWTMEQYDGCKLAKTRGGYLDTITGVHHYGRRS
ncbi:MAG: hypothetical protein KJ822_00615 [Proteobacteria bacterium]|jgi:hypothetical protein|nr:hypothetical protein [Pseudomonadota bacterium]